MTVIEIVAESIVALILWLMMYTWTLIDIKKNEGIGKSAGKISRTPAKILILSSLLKCNDYTCPLPSLPQLDSS